MTTLDNKRNTQIVHDDFDVTRLWHHGSNTCSIGPNSIIIDMCNWDTVTTRRKINAFIKSYADGCIALIRVKGETIIARYDAHYGYHNPANQALYKGRVELGY